VRDVFAADHHGALGDAQSDQSIGEIERRERSSAGIQDVERQGIPEAEMMLEEKRRAGLDGEPSGAIHARDVRAQQQVDRLRTVLGVREAVGDGLPGQVDGELRVPSHTSRLDAREGLERQHPSDAVAAAEYLSSGDLLRREVDTQTLNHRRGDRPRAGGRHAPRW
jgi:hypothetical protein